ncbi:hypothetical protein I7I53_11205 [Histoplasma capsulatum var. duboisii H88]|uniref:Uncharacterized protein n=1 Tax=Ajellomyces capsulatus (strain H88) TaxID=544711 RepID=A0A8A1LDH7_AJEC8|nr:hypothetical protein I7I53_11205 [Histoplasma capsulatum var. duboisii H88]
MVALRQLHRRRAHASLHRAVPVHSLILHPALSCRRESERGRKERECCLARFLRSNRLRSLAIVPLHGSYYPKLLSLSHTHIHLGESRLLKKTLERLRIRAAM